MATNLNDDQEQKRETDLSLDLFIVLTRAFNSVVENAHRDIRRQKLNPTEFAVLELLYHKGPHPIQQIGEKVLLASGSITYVVDKLEKKGYLNRQPSPEDRRITYVAISDKGTELMRTIFPQHAQTIRETLNGLESEEKKIAISLLKKLGKHAEDQLK